MADPEQFSPPTRPVADSAGSAPRRFTSDRERRLWLWTLAAVGAIYATLGPARTLADALRERNLLEVSLGLTVLAVVVATAASWIRRRPGWSDIGVALAVALAYAGMFLRMATPEERTHLIEYGIVAALIYEALVERTRNGRGARMPAAIAIALTAALGSIDEAIQAVLPGRVFDVRDIFFNALAGFMAVAARLAIGPQHRPGWRVWFLWLMAAALGFGNGMYWGWFDGTDPVFVDSTPPDPVAGYLGLAVGAVFTGVLQALVLRRYRALAIWWIVATVAAAGVVGAVMFGVGIVDTEAGWLIGVASFGTAVGVIQWAALRPHVPGAQWWILACVGAWAVSMPLGDLAGPLALGAAYGAATGAVLVALLRTDRWRQGCDTGRSTPLPAGTTLESHDGSGARG